MPNIKFDQLTKESKILKMTVPHLVPVTKNPDDETYNQIVERQEKFLTLTSEIKDKLGSLETSSRIQKIGNYFNLELSQMADIARAVRSYYFGELKLEDMPQVLAREIPIDLEKARQITQMVVKNIIQSDIGTKAVSYENIPLSQALQKYLALGEQLITASPIRLKILPTPVRPSVKNWITDYHEKLGVGRHEVMERGNYLYHSENTKRLTPGERQKLAVILKSLDENEPVSVDAEKQEIVFASQTTIDNKQLTIDKGEKKSNVKGQMSNVNNFSFSSPQQFAVERKEPAPPPQRPTPSPPPPAPPPTPPPSSEAPQAFSKPPRQEHQPYHIYPLGYPEPPKPPEKTEPKVEGNVVDLRGN